MPILQEVQDPYLSANTSAVQGLAGGFSSGPEEAAKAMELGERIKSARIQQEAARQQMQLELQKRQWESQDRTQTLRDEQNVQQYWSKRDPSNPAYWGSVGRMTVHGTKGHDLSSGLDQADQMFVRNHPAPAPIGGAPGGVAPPMPAGLDANGQKKWSEETAKGMADQQQADQQSRVAAAKYLPEMLRARQHYSDASGYIGQFEGNEWTQGPQNLVGKLPGAGGLAQGVERRAALEKEMAAFQGPQIAANNKGLGPMTNYEQQLARLPFAKVNDVNAQVGLDAFDGQLAHTLKTMGYNIPPKHIGMLLNGLKNQDPQVLKDFQEHYGPEALNLIAGALR